MKAFKITGKIEVEKRRWQKFSKEIAAEDEAKAREEILCDLGSRHRTKRRSIDIRSIQEVPKDKITDHAVKYKLGVE
ncbi:MAG TPA: 50S ribosomal protein L18Ae [Thermoplasmata archaeon]|nr:50S ribosomal protein L18Ae [Thermoplasmata archaeon]